MTEMTVLKITVLKWKIIKVRGRILHFNHLFPLPKTNFCHITATFRWRESYIVAPHRKVYLVSALINQYLDSQKKLEDIRITNKNQISSFSSMLHLFAKTEIESTFLFVYRALIGTRESKKCCKATVLEMKNYSINLF